MSSYFRTPAGWIVVALYLLLTGAVFGLVVLGPGRPASMRMFFEASGWLLLPVAPAISMRLFSDELRSGSIETLLTSPVSTAALVLGKYAGAMFFLLVMLAPTLAFPIALRFVSQPLPDVGPVFAGYLCLVLLGMLYLAVGLVATACTSNATLAFMSTLFAILALLLAALIAGRGDLPWLRSVAYAVAVRPRIDDFAKGVIDTSHVTYFLSVSAACVVGAVAALELRRWR